MTVTVTRREARPACSALLGVRRQVWLGTLAATRPGAGKRAARRRLRPLRRPFHAPAWRERESLAASFDSAMTDASPSEPGARRATRPPDRRRRRRSSSSAAPGAAARTCSRSCSPGTRASRWSRSRSASTSRSAAFRACSAGASPSEQFVAPPARLLVEGLSDAPHARHVPVRPRGALRRAPSPRFEAALRRRPRGRLPAALLRPALVPGWRGGSGARAARTGRAELRHDRRGPDPGPAVSRRRSSSTSSATGATPRPRAWPRRGAWSARARGVRASSGGRSGSGGSTRGARDPARAAAHREPRRAPAARRPCPRCGRCAASSASTLQQADAALLPAAEMSAERANAERWRAGHLGPRARPSSSAPTRRSSPASRPTASAARRSLRRTLERSRRRGAERAGAARRSWPAMGRRWADEAPMSELAPSLVFVGGTGRSGTHVVAKLLDQPLALPRCADRVPLPLQPEGPRRRRHRPGDAGGVPAQAAQLLVAPGPARRARPGARGVAGAGEAARSAASTRSSPRERFETRSRGSRRAATATSSQASRDALLRPAAAARRRGRQAGAGRDELLHDRRRARPGADLPRGAVRARRARRARLGLLEGLQAPEGAPPDRRHRRDRVLGGRLRQAEEGVRGLPTTPGACVPISLDELVWGDREGAYADLLDFLELSTTSRRCASSSTAR